MSLSKSGFERKTTLTRKCEFLDDMNLMVPWAELLALIARHAPVPGATGGRPPFAVATMLRIHCRQQWFNLSDPAVEQALCARRCVANSPASMWTRTTCPMTAPFFGFDTRELLSEDETGVCADPGYRGVHKREEVIEAHPHDNRHVAMMPSHCKALYKETPMGVIMEALEKPKAQT